MAVRENKTQKTSQDASAFIAECESADAKQLLAMFKKATGEKPVMWG